MRDQEKEEASRAGRLTADSRREEPSPADPPPSDNRNRADETEEEQELDKVTRGESAPSAAEWGAQGGEETGAVLDLDQMMQEMDQQS